MVFSVILLMSISVLLVASLLLFRFCWLIIASLFPVVFSYISPGVLSVALFPV